MESWKHTLAPNYRGKQSLAAIQGKKWRRKGSEEEKGKDTRRIGLKKKTVCQFISNPKLIISAEAGGGPVTPSRLTSELLPRSLSLLYVCRCDKICPSSSPFYTRLTLSKTEVLMAGTNHQCRATDHNNLNDKTAGCLNLHQIKNQLYRQASGFA